MQTTAAKVKYAIKKKSNLSLHGHGSDFDEILEDLERVGQRGGGAAGEVVAGL
jgi:hypothetical protein